MTAVHSTRLRRRRLENYLVVWLDATIDESSTDCQHALQQLHTGVNDVIVFIEPDAYVHFLQSVKDGTALVIVSCALAQDLVPRIHSMEPVDSIYIFGGDQAPCKPWAEDWSKIKNFYTQIEPICEALQQSANDCDPDFTSMSFVLPATDGSTPDLNELEPSFMYTQLFKNAFLDMDHEPQARDAFMTYCREKKASFPSDLKLIDEFRSDYHADKAIWWYTRECFIYQMLNRALRLLKADIIVNMGFFVHDLHRQIEQLHREQVGRYRGQPFELYRGQGRAMVDFDKLKKTEGGLLSFNSFVSTTKDRTLAQAFAERSSYDIDKIGVIFVMTIDPVVDSTPFADITQFSYFADREAEVLFTMHSVFRINSVKDLDNQGCQWEVKLTLTGDDDPQLRLLTENMNEEVHGLSGWRRIGRLLTLVGHPQKAEALYLTLIEQASDEMSIAYYYQKLGSVKWERGDHKAALSYYEKALDLQQQTRPLNHLDLANSYNNIGSVYSSMGDYRKALSHYERSLDMKQKTLSINHPLLASSHINIGSVYSEMGEYSEALLSYEKALDMQQKTLPANHPHVAGSHNNIGVLYSNMGEHLKALLSHEKALDMRQKTLPADHPALASSHNNIGCAYSEMGEYEKALSYHEKGLTMQQQTLPSNHPDVARTHNNIGWVYARMGEYEKALVSHEIAPGIQQNSLAPNHPVLANYLSNIGWVSSHMGDHGKARLFLGNSLNVLQDTPSGNHRCIAVLLNRLGVVFMRTKEYEKALSHHQKAVHMREEVRPLNRLELAESYNNMGEVYGKMSDLSKALSLYERALKTREELLQENHPDLGTTLHNIGEVHCQEKRFLEALSYLNRALKIRQHSLPPAHPDTQTSLKWIDTVENEMRECPPSPQ